MIVTVDSDVRTLKQGQVFNLDFNQANPLIIVGPNGCGKSSLVNAIRGKLCSNKKTQSESLLRSDLKDLAEHISIEHSYEHIYHLSSQFDDPLNMNNTYDACVFMELGGFNASRISTGQISMMLLNKFCVDNFSAELTIPEKSLLILDEVDKGMDLKMQKRFTNMIHNLNKLRNADVLVITHTTLPMLYSDKVFDFESREFITPEEYCKKQIGRNIVIV